MIGVSRARLVEALDAEGVAGLGQGYENLHLLPMFQNKMAYGSNGFPWSADICKREVNYNKGICPIAEELHDTSLILFPMCLHDLSSKDVELIVSAFKKVWSAKEDLRDIE